MFRLILQAFPFIQFNVMKKNVAACSLFFLFLMAAAAQNFIASRNFDLPETPSTPLNYASTSALKLPFAAGDYDDYGGNVSVGISIFSGFGVPVRYYINPKNVLEGGFYVGGVAIYNSDLEELQSVESGFMAGLGYTYFGNRFLKEKKKRNKVRAHGVAMRANQLFGDFKTGFVSLGWAMETFRENRPNQSFIFELGIQAMIPDFIYEGYVYDEPRPGIYLRCHWNFFLD